MIKFGNMPEKLDERTILFVCVENAGRSQIAKGFFNQKYAPKGYRAISAGIRPVSQINLLAVQAMKEVGIDITNQKSDTYRGDDQKFGKVSKHGLH